MSDYPTSRTARRNANRDGLSENSAHALRVAPRRQPNLCQLRQGGNQLLEKSVRGSTAFSAPGLSREARGQDYSNP